MSDTLVAEVQEYLDGLGDFTGTGGVVVESVDPDDVRVRWTYDEASLRPGGIISGPTLFSIADLCGWVLVFATEGVTPMAVTWDLHITFLRQAIGGDVVAVAKQLKRGRTLIYGDVVMAMAAEPNKPVAHATVTYALPSPETVPKPPG